MVSDVTCSPQADLGVSDRDGRTALHYAVTTRSLPCVQTIVETRVSDQVYVYTQLQTHA